MDGRTIPPCASAIPIRDCAITDALYRFDIRYEMLAGREIGGGASGSGSYSEPIP